MDAVARDGVRGDRGILRIVRPPDDDGWLQARRLHAVAAAAAPNAPPQQGPLPTVVISPRLWKQLYNGDPAVIGKPIHFAELNTTISGVAPRDLDIPHSADIFFAQRTPSTDVNHGQEAFFRFAPRRDDRTRERRDGDDHGRPRHGLSRLGQEPRLRLAAAGRLDRRRPWADPDHRDVGHRAAAPPRVRERRQPSARAGRGEGARNGGARGARRGMEPAGSPTPDRVARAGNVGHDRRSGRRSLGSPRAAGDRRVEAAPPRRRGVRWPRPALFARGSRRHRCDYRTRPRCSPDAQRYEDAHERQFTLGERRPRHGTLAHGDDSRRSRAGDHARSRRGLARARILESPQHRRRLRGGQAAAVRRLFPRRAIPDARRGASGTGRPHDGREEYPRRDRRRAHLGVPDAEPPRELAPRAVSRRAVRRGQSAGHAPALREPRTLRRDGHPHHQGPRFRNGRSPEHGPCRDRQQGIRRSLPQGTRSDRRPVLGRISGTRSEERGDDRRRDRRRAAEVPRRPRGAGVLLVR